MTTLGEWCNYLDFRHRFVSRLRPELYPPAWLDAAVHAGRLTGFFGRESAMLCEIRDYPGGARIGSVFDALGDMDELCDTLRPQAESWARDNGCTSIEIEGRKGWERRLKTYGYAPESNTISKTL